MKFKIRTKKVVTFHYIEVVEAADLESAKKLAVQQTNNILGRKLWSECIYNEPQSAHFDKVEQC